MDGFGNSQGGQGFDPLPGVARELKPEDSRGVLPGWVYLDRDPRFDRAVLQRELGGQ